MIIHLCINKNNFYYKLGFFYLKPSKVEEMNVPCNYRTRVSKGEGEEVRGGTHLRLYGKKYFCYRKGTSNDILQGIRKILYRIFGTVVDIFFKVRCIEKLLRWPEGWKLDFMEGNSINIFCLVKWSMGEDMYVCFLETNTREKGDLS